ncbi:MAG: transglutaminase domain-containing protein [Ruminococcaceae bacterium]|nr:transglutaminase domain-containing protein [Oscillospiraceae bacterium]
MANNKRSVYRAKNAKKAKNQRETFMKMYNRTCEKVYFLSFEHCRNIHDCELIFRDAYVYMYENIGELRKAASLESWQKECVEKAFRALLHTPLLHLIEDENADEISLSLDEIKQDELWNKINKMTDIDPWRNIPEPGKSTVFSVIADQTLSDLRYMSPGDYAKSAIMILAICAAVVVGINLLISFIQSQQKADIETTQEIFLDDSQYEEDDTALGVQVNEDEVSSVVNHGEKLQAAADAEAAAKAAAAAEDEEIASWNTANLSGNYTKIESSGRTSGSPVYTEDQTINDHLDLILEEILTDDMGDFEAIGAIYDYVGKNITFRHHSTSGTEYLDLLNDFFEFHEGDSRHYSALLKALCNAAGYRCETVTGAFVFNANTDFERLVEHTWNKMTLGGITYYLDVEADSNADGSVVRRNYFMAANGNNRWDAYERDHYIQ